MRVRWVAQADVPETFAVDGDVVYVAAAELEAYSLRDGRLMWRAGPRDALDASGGVVIGPEGKDVIRVVAPFEYDLRVDRGSGRILSLDRALVRDVPPNFRPFAAPAPTNFRVVSGLDEIVGFWPDGRVAWRLAIENPFVDVARPVAAGDAIVLLTSGQHVLVLDPVTP